MEDEGCKHGGAGGTPKVPSAGMGGEELYVGGWDARWVVDR